jgi:hypothetical protein
MKKLLVISALSLVVVFSASAQHFIHGGGVTYYAAPRVFVGGGWGIYAPLYPYWAYPYPPYGYGYYRPMSKLDMKIQDIRHDYSEKIASVKQDKALTHKERRLQVRQLKNERNNAIDDAKRNYYKH